MYVAFRRRGLSPPQFGTLGRLGMAATAANVEEDADIEGAVRAQKLIIGVFRAANRHRFL